MVRIRTADELRDYLLSQRVITDFGCWEWPRSHAVGGYGQIRWCRKLYRVNRLSAHFWLGMDLDDPRDVMHKCDNPKCFNPEHLEVGTRSQNMLDFNARHDRKLPAFSFRKVFCKNGHEFNERNSIIVSGGGRRCRICRDDYNRRYRQENK